MSYDKGGLNSTKSGLFRLIYSQIRISHKLPSRLKTAQKHVFPFSIHFVEKGKRVFHCFASQIQAYTPPQNESESIFCPDNVCGLLRRSATKLDFCPYYNAWPRRFFIQQHFSFRYYNLRP